MTEDADEIACAGLVELVTEYLEGLLAPDVRARVDAHLAECDGCRDYLEQIRLTAGAARALGPESVPASTMASLVRLYRRVTGGPEQPEETPAS